MTLQELYEAIDGDYAQALRTLRVEKLIDKHIRKFESSGVVAGLLEAGTSMDPRLIFENAHAVKGVCGNLGLMKIAAAASELTEEYRPGNPRRLSDEQVAERFAALNVLYRRTLDGIRAYTAD